MRATTATADTVGTTTATATEPQHMKHAPTIGAVSSGTMRLEDLIPTFIAEIEYLTGESLAHETKEHEARDYDDLEGIESADWQAERLFDTLGALAPAYCYFGAHEGDGALYGFWPDLDSVRDDIRGGTLRQVDDPDDVPEGGDGEHDGFVFVNDHGNVTLYGDMGAVVWDCV